MNQTIHDNIHRLNYLAAEMDALYHQASQKTGLSDGAMRVLYTIHDSGENCLLSDIYRQSGTSKQTVNSAVRKLEGEGILTLKQEKGRAKRVFLTGSGKILMQQTAKRLYDAECRAFASWTREEFDLHIRLMEKYNASFREQLRTL